MGYTCSRCDHTFCSKHRLPEKHNCISIYVDQMDTDQWFDEKFKNAEKTVIRGSDGKSGEINEGGESKPFTSNRRKRREQKAKRRDSSPSGSSSPSAEKMAEQRREREKKQKEDVKKLKKKLRRQRWKQSGRRWFKRTAAIVVAAVLLTGFAAVGPSLGLGSPADNPWGSEPITVNVTYKGAIDSGMADRALDAELTAWEENSVSWTNQTANFSRGTEREYADLQVVFLPGFSTCGDSFRFEIVGCAETKAYEDGEVVEATIYIEVEERTYKAIRRTIRHEIGHVYGLEHTDSDRLPWMAQSSEVSR